MSLAPNAGIKDNHQFLSVNDLVKSAADLLGKSCGVNWRSNWANFRKNFASLEKIFIEKRIYRDIEKEEAVIAAVDKGLKYASLCGEPLHRDIVRLRNQDQADIEVRFFPG